MGFVSVLGYAHELVRRRLRPGEAAVDATAGGGNDTLLLAQLVGRTGRVIAFDIQQAALEQTGRKLTEAGISWVQAELGEAVGVGIVGRCEAPCRLVPASHAEMGRAVGLAEGRPVGAVMFNLGYLPGADADQTIVTCPESTLPAMEAALRLLRPGGVLTAVLYPGHPGGAEEAAAVDAWAAGLPQAEARCCFTGFITRRPRRRI
ncbi:class I SAM-dependent methyltransferase [Gordoniibacillus kamchatkensis]|uniref:class I SAM-dependent methyltransferase n=1 Tax=Gordoniibacillus kamchatkensis TaxID=1590651 RepID=UPI000A54FB05